MTALFFANAIACLYIGVRWEIGTVSDTIVKMGWFVLVLANSFFAAKGMGWL